jgi:formylglycine-generating enzyme required for sulfatase activity
MGCDEATQTCTYPDQLPLHTVTLDDFYIDATEVTNAQFGRFDPAHDSGYLDMQHKDHTTPGYPANEPRQPVVRISWGEAMRFCEWISKQSGQPFTLPSEAQWEWACRAGAATPFAYGDLSTDFGRLANLADQSIKLLAVDGINPQPIPNPNPYEDWTPKDARFNDGHKVVAPVGAYQPNAWGLCDMHGNVAEWTRSLFKPYPYVPADGREDLTAAGRRVVRGGSWIDRPYRATASYRLAYEAWQPVHNVGFRVICPQ